MINQGTHNNGLWRHCGLDPQSPEYKGYPYCSGDGGCSSAMTTKG